MLDFRNVYSDSTRMPFPVGLGGVEPGKSRDTAIGRMGPAYGRNIVRRRRLAQASVREHDWANLVKFGSVVVVVGGVIALLNVPVGIFIIAVGVGVALWGFATKPQRE